MARTLRRHPIGPQTGSLHLRTGRDGVAARVGHDLLIAMRRWSGQLTVTSDGPVGVEVEVEMDSLYVVAGSGGIVPLGDRDRADITSTALGLLEADQYPLATFASTRVTSTEGDGTVEGALTVRGLTRPLTLEVTQTGPACWRGSSTVQQSAFGIAPYRALFGTLRLADPVNVEVTVDLSGTRGAR